MGLKIVKKRTPQKLKQEKKIAVITILGLIDAEPAQYESQLDIKCGKYKNMLPLLIDNYNNKSDITIISIFTKNSLEKQKNVLKEIEFDIEKNGKLIEEDNFKDTFNIINTILNDDSYTEFIIDISHGFRHLPVLSTVSMIINNFQDSSKIKNILFAKEIDARKKYEIIDLKEYLEIANISFVLNMFNDNYTVANHINSNKYSVLLEKLNNFSNDIMALNLSNLHSSSLPKLCKELDKIEDISVQFMSNQLKEILIKNFQLENKKYLTFYKISKNLCEKNYILLSLSMLYESIRLYIKTAIKKREKLIVDKIEKYFDNDLYKVGDFFKNLEWKNHDDLNEKEKKTISLFEYNKLQKSFNIIMTTSSLITEISNTRNDLSHGNSKSKFEEIKRNTENYIERYNKAYCIEEKLKCPQN